MNDTQFSNLDKYKKRIPQEKKTREKEMSVLNFHKRSRKDFQNKRE